MRSSTKGLGEFLSLSGALVGGDVLELLFKAEKLPDALDGFVREDALALLIGDGGDIEELPAGVGPASDFEQRIVIAGGVGLQVGAVPVLEEIANVLAFLGEVGGGGATD